MAGRPRQNDSAYGVVVIHGTAIAACKSSPVHVMNACDVALGPIHCMKELI